MKPRFAAVLLLVGAALLSSREVGAQARGSVPQASRNTAKTLDRDARARKLMELDAWLRRLVGDFRVSGALYDKGRVFSSNPNRSRNDLADDINAPQASNPKGSMQCLSIGPGPGVHCLVDVNWETVVKSPGGYAVLGWTEAFHTLHPAMMLLALDPDKLAVQLMLVDDRGNADTWDGLLTGDTVTFEEPTLGCWGGGMDGHAPPHCPRRIDITAKHGSEIVTLNMRHPYDFTLFYINLKLHRLPDRAEEKLKRP